MWKLQEYRIATNPAEAVALMRKGPGKGAYIAGGTDMLLEHPACDFVVDINRAGIGDVARTPGGDLFLGAAATLQELVGNEFVTGFAGGAVSMAASQCGNRPVRSTATVGGNLCNALPSADMAPVLLALDATCYIADEDYQESLPLTDFFVGPRLTVLEDRLLVGVALPGECAGWRCASHKLTRTAEDISLVQVAVALGVDDGRIQEARIALGAVAPVPMRASLAETMLTGQEIAAITPDVMGDVAAIAAGECDPLDDHRASAEYRRDMVSVLTRRLVTRILSDDGDNSQDGAA
ncbi:MAG: FAD binding domain-containing protein [Candidatus Krumholzibacteria bacterium]|nr:FAD binding domain-containing protein [Candidatus Krumholzibacteria bacterium]